MDIELKFFLDYLVKEALILVPALIAIGMGLKITPKIQDWMIVWILPVISILLAFGIMGVGVMAVMQGIIAAAVAVFMYQLYMQAKYRD